MCVCVRGGGGGGGLGEMEYMCVCERGREVGWENYDMTYRFRCCFGFVIIVEYLLPVLQMYAHLEKSQRRGNISNQISSPYITLCQEVSILKH